MFCVMRLNYTSTKPPFYGHRERVVFLLAKDVLEEFKLECELRRLTPRTIKGYYNSNGLDVYSVSRLLGHENINITKRYLQSLQDSSIVELAVKTSPLRGLRI